MDCRLINLQKVFLGYQKTGIPLIEYNGQQLAPAFTADDIGIYVIIPKIATLFNLSIEQAINIFFNTILLIPPLIGILGFFKLYRSIATRIVVIIAFLLLTRQARALSDVYLSYFSCVSALIPWSLYFAKRKKYDFSLFFYIFGLGLFTGFFHYIRAYSGIGVCLFTLVLFGATLSCSWKKKMYLIGVLFLGFALSVLYFNNAYNKSVTYAKENLSHTLIGERKHVFWHAAYLGFGFLKFGSPDNIEYDDSCAERKARSKVPNIVYCTSESEQLLKEEVIHLFKNHFKFVLWTLFAKLGILFLYLLIFANIGLIAAFFYPKPWYIELSFFITLLFNSLFPLLTIPTYAYSLGFIATATLYGVVSINHYLEKRNQFI